MAPTEPRKHLNQKPADPPLSSDPNNYSARSARENAATWYMKSWPRKSKAPPVTEVARESITATNTILSERNRSNISLQRSSRNQSIDLMKKGKTSTRSLPADAATTRLNIASTGSSPALSLCSSVLGSESLRNDTKHCRKNPVTEDKDLKKLVGKNDAEGRTTEEELHKPEQTLEPTVEVTPRAPIPELPKSDQLQDSSLNRSSGWFGWLSRNTGDGDGTLVPGGSEPPRKLSAEEGTENSSETEQNQQTDTGINTEPSVNAKQDICTDSTSTQISSAETPIPKVTSLTTSQRRTWLYLWSGNSTAPTEGNAQITELPGPDGQSTNESPAQSGCPLTQEESESGPTIETSTSATAVKEPVAKEVPKSTSWLFWSRESQGLNSDTGSGEVKEATEPLPENSQPILAPLADQTNAQAVQANGKARAKKTVKSGSTGSTKGVATQLSTPESLPEQIKLPSSGLGKQVGPPPNHVLPAFENTFPVQDRPGLFQQLGRLIYYGKGPEPKHVLRTQHRPLIKKALAIGIHGYFPAPLIRNIIGQPTGTSIKFATMAEQAILEWAAHHETPCQVEKIVLEGEGRISERVDLLWKLLLNWIDHLRSADFIMVSCHSQGVPVATMLVAKLIAFGCVTSARIGICAMAGVNLGPFPDYRSRWISGSAGELFDFADSNSKVSQDYMAALNSVLEYGVRITYLGSIDDQLVSLESSVFATVSHPYICRAVFVDGRVHAPSFVSHLVGFAMKLRNLGIYDHGLLRELSSPLAGSLYSGEGHSRLYDDTAVYRLAVQFTLETTSLPPIKPHIHTLRTSSPSNPYILPFAMRGVLEEDFVRKELSEETAELLRQFDDWKPSSKVLKDVKFRLEGIRSKL